jgi:DNA-binding NarL/FixJ family response regulator
LTADRHDDAANPSARPEDGETLAHSALESGVEAHSIEAVLEERHAENEDVEVGLGVLSPRELEVLQLISRGLTNSEVAARLHVTVHAVKFHLAAIYRRLGVSNRTEAAVTYLRAQAETARPLGGHMAAAD